ncbi:MAG: UvrD-helicase domain-containing protein [Victivallaceae bacterium]
MSKKIILQKTPSESKTPPEAEIPDKSQNKQDRTLKNDFLLQNLFKQHNPIDVFAGLNAEQQAIVAAVDGPIRTIAAAGSGKTRVLVHRLCYLIEHVGIDPSRILSITFTNKAASEMRNRIMNMLNCNTDVFTFHGWCFQMLGKYSSRLGSYRNFVVADRKDQLRAIKQIREELDDVRAEALSSSEILEYISEVKRTEDYVSSALKAISPNPRLDFCLDHHDIRNFIFVKYLHFLAINTALDFEDLLHFGLFILRNHKDVRELYQQRYRYIQIDEFQDLNQAQYELISILQEKHKNLFIVGDPSQTIFSWRGSDISFINDFDKRFPGALTFTLSQNYRSTPPIVKATNALIKHNTGQISNPAVAVRKNGCKILHAHCQNIRQEAEFIVEAIRELKEEHRATYEDIAILYRSSFQTGLIEKAFFNAGIPYTIIKGNTFYERSEIKDVLALLRLLVHSDDFSFLQIIRKVALRIGPQRIRILRTYAEKHKVHLLQALIAHREHKDFKRPELDKFLDGFCKVRKRLPKLTVSQALDEIIRETGYYERLQHSRDDERFENVVELKRSIQQLEEENNGHIDIAEYLNEIAVYSDIIDKAHPECVKLLSCHVSKGLEFRFVIISGMVNGIFPSAKISSKAEMEEERRLAYVAMTRARDGLLLTSAARGFDNRVMEPSRFIDELPEEFVEKIIISSFPKKNSKKQCHWQYKRKK